MLVVRHQASMRREGIQGPIAIGWKQRRVHEDSLRLRVGGGDDDSCSSTRAIVVDCGWRRGVWTRRMSVEKAVDWYWLHSIDWIALRLLKMEDEQPLAV